jgi:non-canonical poly(A) RNA polymerase PAPD5/7
MIVEKYPTAKVEYFGSFATKLYLPDGDIDITVLLDDIMEYE